MSLYKGMTLLKTGENIYKYGWFDRQQGGAWVEIRKGDNDAWYYLRLGKISESKSFADFSKCLDAAYNDIIASKL